MACATETRDPRGACSTKRPRMSVPLDTASSSKLFKITPSDGGVLRSSHSVLVKEDFKIKLLGTCWALFVLMLAVVSTRGEFASWSGRRARMVLITGLLGIAIETLVTHPLVAGAVAISQQESCTTKHFMAKEW